MSQPWSDATCAVFDRLMAIDRRSRVMITFMMSHMKEVTGPLEVAPQRYFEACYGDVAQEFFQAAENSFVTHHCARVLHGRWLDLLSLARAKGVPVPELEADVMEGGSLIVPEGYQAVIESLADGELPEPAGPVNQMMKPADCSLFGRDDLIFGQLEIQSGADWNDEVVLMWDLVRDALALTDGGDLGDVAEVAKVYEAWREYHVASARIHSELFGRFSAGMFALVGEQAGGWTLTPVLLHEMYLEVAYAMADLTGTDGALPPQPEPSYWRRTPWSPPAAAPGALGLPPF